MFKLLHWLLGEKKFLTDENPGTADPVCGQRKLHKIKIEMMKRMEASPEIGYTHYDTQSLERFNLFFKAGLIKGRAHSNHPFFF